MYVDKYTEKYLLDCNDLRHLAMSNWIAYNVVYCPHLGSFKAFSAYSLFLTDLKSSVSENTFKKISLSRSSFYKALRLNLSRGLIRSSVETEDLDPVNPSIEVKTPKRIDGLHFEGFRVERYPLGTKELPNLINKKEGLRLWSLVNRTPIERLGLALEVPDARRKHNCMENNKSTLDPKLVGYFLSNL